MMSHERISHHPSQGRWILYIVFIFTMAASIYAQPAQWIALAPLPDARQEIGVATLGGKIYVVGGLLANGATTNLLTIYDPATNIWTAGRPLPILVHHVGLAAANGRIYALGGFNAGFQAISAVFEYDPQADTWTQRASLPTARGAPAVAVIDNKIYVVGGANTGSVRDFAVYDPTTNAWTPLPFMLTPRDHAAAAVVAGKIYVIAGRRDGLNNVAAVEEFDPATNTWRPRAPIPTARSGIAAAAVNNRIYVFGGEGNQSNPNGVFAQVESYEPASDSWRSEIPMQTPRHGIGAAVIGNRIYIPGGATVQGFGATATHDAFEVFPTVLIFPHYADGGGLASEINLINANSSLAIGSLFFLNQAGDPQTLVVNGQSRSSVNFNIPANGTFTITTGNAQAQILVGSVRVNSQAALRGSLIFSGSAGSAGVLSATPGKNFVGPMIRSASRGINAGIAVSNAESEPAQVTLTLRNEQGTILASLPITIPRLGQRASFLDELFGSAVPSELRGSLTITSDKNVVATVLLVGPNDLATVPIN